jgi:glycosyltransferase involved in cell wall biosynthesis
VKGASIDSRAMPTTPHPSADTELPAVSIVVAVYNAATTLAPCLDSLLALDYPRGSVEVLCVDNASTDTTPSILRRYAERITILHEARRGPAAARNCGLRHASGDAVAFIDSDCIADTSWLRQLVQPLHTPSIGVVGGRILSVRPCNSIEAYGERIHDHNRAINGSRPPYAITMNWASPRCLLERLRGFNEDLRRCEDVDLSYRVIQAGYRLVYQPAAIIYHHNERTPWGLMREGYLHGYHALQVRQLHAAFLAGERERQRAMRLSGPAAPPPLAWRAAFWNQLFRLGKRGGRAAADLRAALQRPDRTRSSD